MKVHTQPKISIIIPVYNVEKYISYCLNSLLNQGIDKQDMEVLIIDDGSKDESISIAKTFTSKHSNINIYTKENGGVGSARNLGIKMAKGTYLYFLDPDDYLVDDGLRMVLDQISGIDAEIVSFKSKTTTNYHLNSYTEDVNLIDNQYDIQDGLSYIGNIGYKNEVWWYIVKSEFLKSIGLQFIEGRWMEDAIFTANLLVQAKRVCQIPITIHRHMVVPNSAMTNREAEHYKKVIYDNANAAIEYDKLIKSLPQNERNKKGIERLNIRKQSFVFFFTIRAIRSKEIDYNELHSLLIKMKTVGAYPISKTFLNDYTGKAYIVLRIVLNNPILLFLAFRGYKLFKYFRFK